MRGCWIDSAHRWLDLIHPVTGSPNMPSLGLDLSSSRSQVSSQPLPVPPTLGGSYGVSRLGPRRSKAEVGWCLPVIRGLIARFSQSAQISLPVHKKGAGSNLRLAKKPEVVLSSC